HRGIELDAKAGIIYHLLDEQRFTGDSLWILSSHLVGDYPRDARAWAVAGDVAAHFRQFDEAKSAYIRAIDLNPKTPILWQQLVELLAIRGEMEEAKQVGHHASNLFPQQAEILLLTGNIFQSTDEHESARSYLEGALNVADEKHEDLMASIYSALGSTYHALKLYSASDVAFTEALLLDSLHPVALNNYAYYLAQRKDKLDNAAALAKKVVELHPGESTYEDTYAWVLYQQGNFAEALVWIRKALSRSQHPSSTLLEHYGDILYQNGKKREALVQWKLARVQLTENDDTAEQLSRKIHAKILLP